MLIGRHVAHLSPALPLGHRQLGFLAIGAAAALGFACYAYFRPRVDANDLERRRRLFLAEYGRITDATLVDSHLSDASLIDARRAAYSQVPDPHSSHSGSSSSGTNDPDSVPLGRPAEAVLVSNPAEPERPTPAVLVYVYRVGGVSYECAQDVSLLADHVRNLRIDLPIQVRYDPHNPSNSIVVAETWSGLRLDPHHPAPPL
jgi:hypothetical protein